MHTLVSLQYCQISCGEGLGISPCIMELTTQDPYILKEHTKLYKIIKFRVIWTNTEQDTAIQNLQTNVWIAGQSIHFLANFGVFEWLYLVQYWPN